MKELFDVADIARLDRRFKKAVVAAVAIAAAAVGLSALLFCTVTRQTRAVFCGLVIAELVLCGWGVIFCLTGVILPMRGKRAHIKRLFAAQRLSERAAVLSLGKPITVSGGARVIEVGVIADGKRRARYWDIECGAPPFSAGDDVLLVVADNYIIGYEICKDKPEISDGQCEADGE